MSASRGKRPKPPSMLTAELTISDIQSPASTQRITPKRPRASGVQHKENTSAVVSPTTKRRAVTTPTNDACVVVVDSKDDGTAIATHNEITLDIRNMAKAAVAPSPRVKIQLHAESPWVATLLTLNETCAKCKADGVRCEVLPAPVIKQAWWLQYKLLIFKHNGMGEGDILKNQPLVRRQLQRYNDAVHIEPDYHELQMKGFYQGFKTATSILDVDETVNPRVKSFRHGVGAMASLIKNPTGSRVMDRFRGVEAAMALAKDTEDIRRHDQQGFRQGAEAVASMLGCGNGEHNRHLLEDFCRGFDSTMAHVEDVCGEGDASW